MKTRRLKVEATISYTAVFNVNEEDFRVASGDKLEAPSSKRLAKLAKRELEGFLRIEGIQENVKVESFVARELGTPSPHKV